MSSDVFRAIADPARRRILDLLAGGDRHVGELHAGLAPEFDFSQPALSQHLRVLRDAGLVTQHREGRHQRYALRAEPLRAVIGWVAPYERFWEGRLRALGAYLDAEAVVEDVATGLERSTVDGDR